MNKSIRLNRRGFFNLVAASGFATVGAPQALHGSNIRARTYSPDEFEHVLRGPIVSIPTPFTANFDVDESGLDRMIARRRERKEIFLYDPQSKSLRRAGALPHAICDAKFFQIGKCLLGAGGARPELVSEVHGQFRRVCNMQPAAGESQSVSLQLDSALFNEF